MHMLDETPDPIQIAIFARAPVAGYAKTRLIPLLGPQGAADLQAVLVRRTVEMATRSPLRPISLWCAPDQSHDLFASLSQEFTIDTHQQIGSNLGARMLHSFEALTQKGPVILIGTDCPALAAEHLVHCSSALRDGADAAFIPAEDGGYALIGLKRPVPQLFEDMPWGTNEVMSRTRDRLRELRLDVFEAHEIWDIDTPADFLRAQSAGLVDSPSSESTEPRSKTDP
jgi:rSAM/selenodomain-associated transferase 1